MAVPAAQVVAARGQAVGLLAVEVDLVEVALEVVLVEAGRCVARRRQAGL